MKNIKNFPIIDAVILAGGRGSRVKEFLNGSSKPMMKFKNKPLIDYIIKKISTYPINQIFILCGYKGNQIYKKFNNSIQNFVPIKCIIEKKPMGTGGALKLLKKKISKNFIVINGDTFFDIDYSFFFKSKNKNKNYLVLAKNKTYKDNKKLVCLNINKNNKIFFDKKSKYINGGIYFLNKSLFKKLNKFKKIPISLENDIIKNEINEKKVSGIKKDDFFLDIGTKKNLLYGRKKIPKITTKPAIFFDRDGVINFDKGYTYKITDFKFKPGIIKFLQEIKNKKYIFIVTNQAGVAHGIFTEKDFIKLHLNLKKFLINKNILIDDVKFCLYHPKAIIKKYRKNTAYRKPGNLMIEDLKKNWNLNLRKSLMIGDKKTDKICSVRSKIKFIYSKKLFKQ